MGKEIFRQNPLEKLTTPDELQERLTIVSFKSWIALSVLGLLLLFVILWTIFGEIPVLADGKAILFDTERNSFVYSGTSGTVTEIKIEKNDQIAKNQELMILDNPQIKAEILEKKELITSIETYLEETPVTNQDNPLLLSQIEDRKLQLISEKAKLANLELVMAQATVKAPFSATVIDVNVEKGTSVSPGTILMWLQAPREAGEKQNIYGIIPFEEGQRIQIGMRAKIALASVDVTRYGFLLGSVKEILPFLAPLRSDLLKMVPSQELQEYISLQKAHVIIKIEPLANPATFTGYKWTTKDGPPFLVAEGSMGHIEVILDTKRPISFLIPVID